MKPVSIAFPCWNRGVLLAATLESIAVQDYPVELIVVESGDDELTEDVARDFGAKYLREPRDEYPVFQNIAKMWNRCWHEATNEIVILQCAEVLHESDNVIADLVQRVESGEKILATPLIKDLNPDGSFAGWYNHPREGSRPGWVSGAGPHAFRKSEMEQIGGYEELYYGYGGEDNYWMYLLRANRWSIEYVESAVCAHQWHERTKYEPVTGYANRSLTNLLLMEIEEGKRLPLANRQPLDFDLSVTEQDVTDAVVQVLELNPGDYFKEWANDCWLVGNRHPDITFVAQRSTANEGLGRISQIGEMVTEAAWAIVRAREAQDVAENAFGAWATRASKCAEIDITWAARSINKAKELMKQCAKSS